MNILNFWTSFFFCNPTLTISLLDKLCYVYFPNKYIKIFVKWINRSVLPKHRTINLFRIPQPGYINFNFNVLSVSMPLNDCLKTCLTFQPRQADRWAGVCVKPGRLGSYWNSADSCGAYRVNHGETWNMLLYFFCFVFSIFRCLSGGEECGFWLQSKEFFFQIL